MQILSTKELMRAKESLKEVRSDLVSLVDDYSETMLVRGLVSVVMDVEESIGHINRVLDGGSQVHTFNPKDASSLKNPLRIPLMNETFIETKFTDD